jgi:hypothetical protein
MVVFLIEINCLLKVVVVLHQAVLARRADFQRCVLLALGSVLIRSTVVVPVAAAEDGLLVSLFAVFLFIVYLDEAVLVKLLLGSLLLLASRKSGFRRFSSSPSDPCRELNSQGLLCRRAGYRNRC